MTTVETPPAEEPRSSTPVFDASRCWFMASSEIVPLQVGGIELAVCRDVSTRVGIGLTDGLETDDFEGILEYRLRLVAAFLRGWSLPTELPDGLEDRVTLLRSLRSGRFDQLHKRIVEHDATNERRYYGADRFTAAEWAVRIEVEQKKPAGERVTMPAWGELKPYIEPALSVAADAWFVTEDDGVTLQLPDNHWFRIKSELTQGEFIALAATKAKDGEAASVPRNWVGARKLASYLHSWSMVYPDGRPVPPVLESLVEMDATKYSILHRTITAYEELLKKEREANPTGAQ
jgi:hypothetical protein